jgi:filamentous hemagglutinin
MNQNLFRLVFNAARGQVMAVSEVSVGKGKAARGERRGRNVVLALFAFALSPLAWAQVIADPNAPGNQKPQIVTSANGVTQVNIQTPSAGGVSRNVYSQFDVNAQGVILNNSTTNVQTQLGGWVQSNGNLAGGSARVILNEVNSSNPSQLRGFVEVAGQRAEVIIANPAGIAINGGGFINASGVTLTTGTPAMNGGNLDGYRVQRGTITVDGAGLDTSNADYTNIIARAIQVNAGIWAKDLKVTAGANDVNAANTTRTAIAGTGTAPTVALDVAALGGMYAGKITLVGTEAGLGVRNAGSIAANGGPLVVQANGMLTNTGLMEGQTAVIKATTVNNTGSGQIYGDTVAIQANTLNNTPAVVGQAAPVIAARTGRMDLGVGTLNNQEGAVIYSQGDLAIGGSLDANNLATGRASTVTNNSATIESLGSVDIKTQNLTNSYTSLTYRVEAVSSLPGSSSCGDDCYSNYTETTYRAVAVDGVNGAGKILATNNITLDASNNALNSSSQILAGGVLNITGTAVNNQGIDVALFKEQRGTTYQRRTERYWDWGWKERAWWEESGYSNNVADNQTVQRGESPPTSPAARSAFSPNASTVANLPTSAQYRINNNLGDAYLVEANPRFANMRTWLGSDYMLASLALDPSVTQKRLGDGFYEQRLINEQVAQLTGRRYLGNYTSDEAQYQALMNGAITYAQTYNLRPGIALTAEQVAQLTSDIVWLVEKEVTLNDGSKQRVLVPQVYAMVREGDLSTTGALLSGDTVNINTSGDVSNSGSILGRQLVQITAQNVNNLAGLVQGDAVNLQATQDINNIGGTVAAQSSLTAVAGRDLNVESTTKQTANTGSGRSADSGAQGLAVSIGASGGGGGVKTTNETVSRVAGLYVTKAGGTLLASAGRDANLIGALIQSNGDATIAAAENLNFKTINTSSTFDATIDADNFNRKSQSAEVGTTVQSTGQINLQAGKDIKARAADVQSNANVVANAGGSVTIEAGVATNAESSGRTTAGSSFFASNLSTDRQSRSQTQAVASNFGGSNVTVTSSQDISIKASNVVADKDLTLTAGNNVTIEAGTNTQTRSSFSAKSESGLMSGGDLGLSIGTREQSTDQKSTSTTAAASTVGSTGGNVRISAGQTYTQTGSDVLATGTAAGTGNIDITAKKVDIVEARETSSTETKTEFKQSGITVSLSNPVVSAAQTMQKMATAAENTKSDRMKALAAASGILASKGAVKELGNLMNGQASSAKDLEFNISIGSSSSESTSTNTSNTARGSTVTAGGNTTIRATGDGTNSNLTIQGSTVQSGDTTTLAADNQVLLLAAANTATQTSDQKSSSASVGVTVGKHTGFTVSASQGSGDGNGQDVYYTNTQVKGGKVVNIQSAGDTTLRGAVVQAETVNADIGGNLQIESLQDSSRYKESSQNSSGSLTVGYGAGGSVSVGATKINSNYQSVTEQSAIRAGDGGFNVNVQGNTDLKAGAITSKQKAIDDDKNSFQTAKLTTSDIQNSASYSAESYQVTVGTSGGSAGAGKDSGQADSTTKAAISGIAGNTAARTGDAETGIQKIFDQTAVSKEVNAQVAITQEFGKQAPKAVADYAQAKADALAKTDPEEAKKWAEGGVYRIALHATLGALTGGASGAAGAATIAAAAPLMDQLQEQLAATLEKSGLSKEAAAATAKTIAQTTALAVGTAVGGVQGGAMALNVDANNRQLHPMEVKWIKNNAKNFAKQLGISEAEAEKRLARQAFREVQFGAEGQTDTGAQAFLKTAGNQLLPGDANIPGQTVGYMFNADPIQKANASMYASAVVNSPDTLAFYAQNGITQPTVAQIQAAAAKDADARQILSNATVGAAGLAVAATLPPALSWCLSNPVACNRIVFAGGEIAAGDALGPTGLAIGAAAAGKAGLTAIKSAEEANAAMRAIGMKAAWSPGTAVISAELRAGTKVQMVVTEAQFKTYEKTGVLPMGGWATFDDVASQAAARQDLALLSQFKSDVKYVIEYEVIKPLKAEIGFVGKQTEPSGQLLRGGGTQAAFEWTPDMKRADYLKLVGVPKPLPNLSN